MPEGLSATEVGKEIGEHREHTSETQTGHDRLATVIEAVLLSVVALLAAWSGYSAAKWSTESSLSLAKAAKTRASASVAQVQATEIRTLDSVSFNAVLSAYLAHDQTAIRVTEDRLRPGYRPAFDAWLATRPLVNPRAPPGPSYMPQYKIPQEAAARALGAKSTAYFDRGEAAAGTADKYVRLTVLLAAVLFLVGIGSRFPLRTARHVMIVVAAVLLVISVVELLGLPGPPS